MGQDGPSVTASALIAALTGKGLVDELGLISLLGVERHGVSVERLESALIASDTLSNRDLLGVKGMISGLPVLDEPQPRVLPLLPAPVAKQNGALVVDRPVPTVAFVEDLPRNIERVGHQLNRGDFAICLMTAPQFVELFKATYQEGRAEARPATANLAELFDECITEEASDIHLSVGVPPVLRIDGELRRTKRQPIDEEWLAAQVVELLGEDALREVRATHNRDAGFTYGDVRFRINVGQTREGLTMAIRRLPSKIPTFDDLRLPPAVRKFAELERGLVLVTGPTGSGKSTTLAALLSHIALNQPRHILTLEDPIEFLLPSKRALVHQRELGRSFTSFAQALKQSLRQDPDVVLVGEARDPETIGAAVTAAETGALVFATLHTYDATQTISRVVNSFPAGEQEAVRNTVAYVLKGVVSQTLVRAVGGGRVAALEVLVSTPGIVNNLRKADGILQIKQALSTGMKDGMQTMEWHLADLVKRGLVRLQDAEFKARDLGELHRHLRSASATGPASDAP